MKIIINKKTLYLLIKIKFKNYLIQIFLNLTLIKYL